MSRRLEILPVDGLGEFAEGDSIAAAVLERTTPAPGDVVCVSQKVVSKVEGRLRDLDRVQPSPRAQELARRLGKDPAMVELVLAESARVVRAERGVLIVETHGGLVCANAGIDASNVPGERTVALLPTDPDRSAREIRAELQEASGVGLAVVVCDSFGRAWRLGQAEVAIGCAGIEPLEDWRGRNDTHGRELAATAPATADQLAAAADLARDKSSGTPVVIVRGLQPAPGEGGDGPGARALRRPAEDDLFR